MYPPLALEYKREFHLQFLGGPLDGYLLTGDFRFQPPVTFTPITHLVFTRWLGNFRVVWEGWQIYHRAYRTADGVFIYRYGPEAPERAATP